MNIQKKAIDLTDLAIGILVLGIIVSIGTVIMVNMRDSRLTSLATETFQSESITPTDDGASFSNQWFKEIINCYNDSTLIVQSGNYTII